MVTVIIDFIVSSHCAESNQRRASATASAVGDAFCVADVLGNLAPEGRAQNGTALRLAPYRTLRAGNASRTLLSI
jgi:hypothetical protein